MEAVTELTGGCGGHFGEDDRCYCDSPDVHIEFRCPNHQVNIVVGNKMKKNPKFCKQPNLSVGEISDQYSLARWFTENYVPGPNSKIFEKKKEWWER